MLVLAACGPRTYARDEVPVELEASVAKAEAAMDGLQQRLSARLAEAITSSGPVAAITVCRDEAKPIASAIAREHGVAIGRTSHRLRNPTNVAPSWLAPMIERAAVEPPTASVVVDLGDRVGVVRPLFTEARCLTCHGPAEQLAPELRDTLAHAYPDDRATGFAAGELRGLMWAEAPR